jgi:hypothetical protein
MSLKKKIRIGLVLTSPQSEAKKDELCKYSAGHRPWLQDIPQNLKNNKYCVKRLGKWCCAADVSIGLYILKNYKNIEVDFIAPKEITSERLKKNTINFFLIYDLLEAFHNHKNLFGRMHKALKKAKNIYPPYKYQVYVNDKSKYISDLARKKVNVISSFGLTSKKYQSHSNKDKLAHEIYQHVQKKKWKRFIAKPLFGQESKGFFKFGKTEGTILMQLKRYMQKLFKQKYPGILFQEYIEGFDKKNPEIRMYFINGKYVYSVITTNKNVSFPKQERGTLTVPFLKQLKQYAKQVFHKLPPIMYNKKKFPKLLTRIDIACDRQFKKPWRVNEIEFVPSLYVENVKGIIPEEHLAKVMVNIARKIKLGKNKKKQEPRPQSGLKRFRPNQHFDFGL